MISRLLFATLALLVCHFSVSQPVRLKLNRQINVPNYNHFAPSLTADGLTLLYASDYYVSNGNKCEMKLNTAKGIDNWGAVEEITVVNKWGTLNQHGGHCISADGQALYFSSRKTGGVAGFDIWTSEKKDGLWLPPHNLGKPVNTEGNEAFPSISPDGKYLYFLRCQTMTNQNCEDCKIYVSELKSKDFWKEPTVLPSNVNQGNVLYPRILKDGKTLLFSSDKPGGKGDQDLYVTKKTGEGWSNPLNIEVLNTPDKEIFADMSIQNEAITYASFVDNFWVLYKAKLPEKYQPEPVYLFQGKVTSNNRPLGSAFIQIMDNIMGTPILMKQVASDGKFAVVLPKDKQYDVALIAGNENFHWSSILNAQNLGNSKKEEVEIAIQGLQQGKLYPGRKALFDSTTYKLLAGATLECKRIAKIAQTHPAWKFEVILYPNGISDNEVADPAAAFDGMKTSIQTELIKLGLGDEKASYTNGTGSAEEENNYSGWAIKILP